MANSCAESGDGCQCLKVQALVSVDERGQMVLPKDVREKAGIRGGDKLALTTLETGGKICCLVLTKADEMAGTVRAALGTAVGDLADDR